MKRDWLLYLVIFSLALNVGTIGTFAYLHVKHRQETAGQAPEPPRPVRELLSNLNLDDNQRAFLRKHWPKHFRQVRALRQELAQRRQELVGLVKQDPAAWPALQAKVKEISGLQGRLEEEVLRFFLQFQKELKPEQNAAFLVLMESRLAPLLGGQRGRPGGRGMKMAPSRGRGMNPDCPMPGQPGPSLAPAN
jgi:Spy/CpxP family protein refolding chaperone